MKLSEVVGLEASYKINWFWPRSEAVWPLRSPKYCLVSLVGSVHKIRASFIKILTFSQNSWHPHTFAIFINFMPNSQNSCQLHKNPDIFIKFMTFSYFFVIFINFKQNSCQLHKNPDIFIKFVTSSYLFGAIFINFTYQIHKIHYTVLNEKLDSASQVSQV